MANGFVFGKGGTPSGGGTESVVVPIPQMTLSYIGEYDVKAIYGVDFDIPFPLQFKSRVIQSPAELWEAVGYDSDNIDFIPEYGTFQGYIMPSSITQGYIIILQFENTTYSGSLEIRARFVN